MILKVLADGFIFTPKAVIRDTGGVLDLFIYTVRSPICGVNIGGGRSVGKVAL